MAKLMLMCFLFQTCINIPEEEESICYRDCICFCCSKAFELLFIFRHESWPMGKLGSLRLQNDLAFARAALWWLDEEIGEEGFLVLFHTTTKLVLTYLWSEFDLVP